MNKYNDTKRSQDNTHIIIDLILRCFLAKRYPLDILIDRNQHDKRIDDMWQYKAKIIDDYKSKLDFGFGQSNHEITR